MAISMSGASAPVFRRVMLFIDGGYLRERLKEHLGKDTIDYHWLSRRLTSTVDSLPGHFSGELIRAYYYDANVAESEGEDWQMREEYFRPIRAVESYEVRLGRLKKSSRGRKQKGVDTLVAIDMITKAYQDHYDIGVLLAGDDDFVDIVRAVKNTGKRVFGVYFQGSASEELLDSLDRRFDMESLAASLFT